MNLIEDKINKIYYNFLLAAFGSAMISAIYGLVDMAMVGQYAGPQGTAALAVVSPIWNIIYSLGLLTGIGGAALFSNAKGKKDVDENQYFTVAVAATAFISVAIWILLVVFENKLLILFGADEILLPIAKEYIFPIKFVIPLFLFYQMIIVFLRNDNDAALATWSVIGGGILNIIGDYVFIFVLKMGVGGAGIATVIGIVISLGICLLHFLKKKNKLKFVKTIGVFKKTTQICFNGFSAFFIDFAMGILTIMFNRQIMKYNSTDALAVYGIINNIAAVIQCCAYAIGQASQPIISINYGAGRSDRIKVVLNNAIVTSLIFGIISATAVMIKPNIFVYIFMKPTPEVLKIAPLIMRLYALSFVFLPLNVFSTYYFQSIMKMAASFIISVLRGIVISGILIYTLPLINPNLIWLSIPITEITVFGIVFFFIMRYIKKS